MRLLIILALLVPGIALADEYRPEFRWEPPTEWESGAPLDPATDLSEYRLYCAGIETTQTLPNEGNQWTAPHGMFPPGEHSCHMTAVAINGEESRASNTKTFTVSPDRPAPVVVFEVQ